MKYLALVIERGNAIPDETYPEYNAGYETGHQHEVILDDEEPDNMDSEMIAEVISLGDLGETKIC